MDNKNAQIFRMDEHVLYYDYHSGVILCRSIESGRNLWIKKTEDSGIINGAIEDEKSFYIAFESGERSGIFLTLSKKDGSTLWDIPGCAYLYRIFLEYIFLIFIDDSGSFFLLKVSAAEGTIIWHHNVTEDLYEYVINKDYLLLKYSDGRIEKIDNESGTKL